MMLDEHLRNADIKLTSLGGKFVFSQAPPAGEEVLKMVEDRLGLRFAPSHRRFLEKRNGCEIKIMPDRGIYASGIEIFEASVILERTLSYQRIYSKPQHAARAPFWRQLVIVGLADSGDFVLTVAETPTADGEYTVLDGFNEDPPSWRSRVIARSFHEFIDRIFQSIMRERAPQYWVAEDETISQAFVKWPRITAE